MNHLIITAGIAVVLYALWWWGWLVPRHKGIGRYLRMLLGAIVFAAAVWLLVYPKTETGQLNQWTAKVPAFSDPVHAKKEKHIAKPERRVELKPDPQLTVVKPAPILRPNLKPDPSLAPVVSIDTQQKLARQRTEARHKRWKAEQKAHADARHNRYLRNKSAHHKLYLARKKASKECRDQGGKWVWKTHTCNPPPPTPVAPTAPSTPQAPVQTYPPPQTSGPSTKKSTGTAPDPWNGKPTKPPAPSPDPPPTGGTSYRGPIPTTGGIQAI